MKLAERRRRPLLVATLVSGASLLLVGPLPRLGAPAALGQGSTLTRELETALDRAGPGEAVPVVIELQPASAPRPLALERRQRAAEYAADLAGLYDQAARDLRRSAPADVAADLSAGQLLWIGGAMAARLTPAEIRVLAGQPGVRTVYYDGLTRVDLPGGDGRGGPIPWDRTWGTGAVAQPDVPWDLEAIGAPELWAAGATGQGTVVAFIDSGVDGEHPLLSRKWRGLSTSPSEAWFDPWGLTDRPVDDNHTAGIGHGTIVAATAVGALEPGDTVVEADGSSRVVQGDLEVVTGVAPDAEWIAANAFQEFGDGTYTRRSILLQALQWALDPDGDPVTPSDVPDVVNNSWGFLPGRCDGVFDRAIDALELAGVPVVFASGNRSNGFDTVAAPANRADLLLNAFAVGAVQLRDSQVVVAENSLGGPSPCAPGAIKPEVVAPGLATLVRREGAHKGEIRGLSGPFTSWAAPHASGALALLRGLNAGASANDLKEALYATARDLPPPGPDNRSGAGLIDVVAAADRIGGLGGVRLELAGWRWEGNGTRLILDLLNRGDRSFPGGAAELRTRRAGEVLARSQAPAIGPRARGDVAFDGVSLTPSPTLSLDLRLDGEGGRLDLPVLLIERSATRVELQQRSVVMSLDANGRIGATAGSPGFVFAGRDWLTGGGLLVSAGDVVSDGVYVDVQARPALKSDPVGSDTDWRGAIVDTAGAAAQLELTDARSLRPIGVRLDESARVVSIDDSAAYALLGVTFDLKASEPAPLAGLLLDWDFPSGDRVLWDPEMAASVMTAADGAGPWMALAVVPSPPATVAAVPLGDVVDAAFTLGSGVLARPFDDATKARLIRLGGSRESGSGVSDWAQMVTTGPVRTGQKRAFVIAVASSRAGLAGALDQARAAARRDGLADSPPAGAEDLTLLPPYPNPFDPNRADALTLPFLVSRGSESVQASLEIFTISGRRVRSERRVLPSDAPVEPFRWDGRLADGDLAATGIYGYVIRVGNQEQVGRFLILK